MEKQKPKGTNERVRGMVAKGLSRGCGGFCASHPSAEAGPAQRRPHGQDRAGHEEVDRSAGA
ncbi:hypothetical protein [Streptomyces sp. NPDC058252]|uniref:hypothetical protein n=1 Tax=Streptomyces sp. NPDC058252 TaxID=3346405 RepID=UPI0036E8BA55